MEKTTDPKLTGLVRCTRYAFMPNRLHFCGPENQADILEFYAKSNQGEKVKPIQPLIEQFETLYPYLKLIARANNIKNPLDERVVQAYWLGGQILENVSTRSLYKHLTDALAVRKKLGMKQFSKFSGSFSKKSLPHHNFHVFSIFRRTGKTQDFHTLATMDACRISWGVVTQTNEKSFKIKTRPLFIDKNGYLKEGEAIEKEIFNEVEGALLLKNIKRCDFVSLHWGSPCERLTPQQVIGLQEVTDLSLAIVNSELLTFN